MKKIKLSNNIFNQYKAVYEDTSTGVVDTSVDTTGDEILEFDPKFQITFPRAAQKRLDDTIRDNVYKSKIFVRVKLTKNFYDAVSFPTACTELNRLVQFVDFPGYLKDLGGRLESDPKVSIQQAPDYAAASFKNTEFDIISYDPDAKKTNESYEYDYNQVLNEEGEAAALGTMAGNLAVQLSKEVASGVSAFATAVGPTVAQVAGAVIPPVALGFGAAQAGGYFLGSATMIGNTDHANFPFINDKQYDVDYTAIPTESILKSTDPIVAIDHYIKQIQHGVTTLLQYITAKSARTDITDLQKTINILNGKANKSIEAFIRDNNETLRTKQEQEVRDRLNKKNEELDKAKTIAKIRNIVLKNSAYEDERKNMENIEKWSLWKLEQYEQELERKYNTKEKNDSGIAQLIIQESQVLNEEDDRAISEESSYIVFNADPIYEEIKTTLEEKIIKILGTDPEDWECIKFARKEMDLMQEQADKEIQARIEVICRMGNADNMGLGDKLAAFIRKHPLRASYLKGLWARYMRDLDVRKQRRLDNITKPNNASPMAMCLNFLQVTYPNLMAMMLTYKTLIQLITDARCRTKRKDVMETDQIDEITATESENAANELETIFGGDIEAGLPGYGRYLAAGNNDNKSIYNVSKHTFAVNWNSLTRFGLFISQFIPKLNKDNIDIISGSIATLKGTIVTNNQKNSLQFYDGFVNLLDTCGKLDLLLDGKLCVYFDKLHDETNLPILDILDNISNLKPGEFKDKLDNADSDSNLLTNLQYFFAYIIASKGEFINNYNKAKEQILGLSDDAQQEEKKKIKELLFVNIDNDSISTEYDNIESILTDETAKAIFNVGTIDSYLLAANLYYRLGLYACTKVENPTKTNINYSLVLTIMDILTNHFDKLSIILNDDSARYDLINFSKNYTGTNGSIDALGLFNLIHQYIGVDVKEDDKMNYPEYATTLDKQLKSETPIAPQIKDNAVLKNNKIQSFEDIVERFTATPAKIKSIDDLIKHFTEEHLKDVKELDTAATIFKAYLKQVVSKFDEDFAKTNLDVFDSFIGTKEDNEKITDENILVGYANGQAKMISFQEFLGTYSTIHDSIIALDDITPDTPDGTSEKSTKDLFVDLEDKLNKKIRDNFLNETQYDLDNQKFFGSDGIFLQLSKLDMTRANIIAIIKKMHVVSDGQTYEASTEMLVRNSLLNFLPEIFKIPLVTGFINLLYGDEHGKIYTMSK